MTEIPGANTQAALLQSAQNDSLSAARGLDEAKKSGNVRAIEEAAKDFEAVFVSEMIKPMFAGLETDGPFGGGHAEEVYRSLMVQEYGKKITEAGGLGIAAHVKAELLRIQEGANHATAQ